MSQQEQEDWTFRAARIIMLQYDMKGIVPTDTSVYRLSAIIMEHCPLKPDTAYMEVPRCEACKHSRLFEGVGRCTVLNLSIVPEFGCIKWEAKC